MAAGMADVGCTEALHGKTLSPVRSARGRVATRPPAPIAHPCLQLAGFIFELGALVKLVDAELEDLGYSHKYHEEVTKVLAKVKDRWRMIVEEERAVEEQRAAERPRPLAVGLQAGGAPLPPPAATSPLPGSPRRQ